MHPLRSVTGLCPRTRTAGLTPGQVADSKARFGLNRRTPRPRGPVWVTFLGKKDVIRSTVVRGGRVVELPLDELAIGDLVALEPGAVIPADGRTSHVNELLIDQSLMTDEPELVPKDVSAEPEEDGPDRPRCVCRGARAVGVFLVGRMTRTSNRGRRRQGIGPRGARPQRRGELDRTLVDAGGRRPAAGNTAQGALFLWLADGGWRSTRATPIDSRAVRARHPVVYGATGLPGV